MQDELPHSAGSPKAYPRGALQGVPPLPHVWEDLQRPFDAGAAHGDPRWREALQLWDLQQGLPGELSFCRHLSRALIHSPFGLPWPPCLWLAEHLLSPGYDHLAGSREECSR